MPMTCDGSAADALLADELAMAGQRLAEWLAPFSAKGLMTRFRVSLDTAKGWKAGQMPANRHLLRMVRDWGDDFLAHLFQDQLGAEVAVEARLERALRIIDQVKTEIEHERKTRRGAVGRAVGVVAAGAGRMAGQMGAGAVAAGTGMAQGVAAVTEAVAKPVRATAAAAGICLSLSGAPDDGRAARDGEASHG